MVLSVCDVLVTVICNVLNIFLHLWESIKWDPAFQEWDPMVDPASLVCGNAGSTMDPAITTWERAEIPPHRFYSWFGGRNIFLD